MKWLFIILLLVNVIYLGYEMERETRLGARGSASALSIPGSASRLKLLSEIKTPPASRVVDTPVNQDNFNLPEPEMDETTTQDLVLAMPDIVIDRPDDIGSTLTCFRYGPIPEENMVKGLYDWFRSRNVQARIQYTEDEASQMFWIYLAPQQSRETALAVIAEMQSKGIGDFRLINRGDLENAISLGLFSSRDAVNNRLRELNDKGFVPVVVPYADVQRIFWLDIKMAATSMAADEIYSGFPARYESVPVNCDDISGL